MSDQQLQAARRRVARANKSVRYARIAIGFAGVGIGATAGAVVLIFAQLVGAI